MTLDPERNDTSSYMIRGQGWFIIRGAETYFIVADGATVTADHVALETGGTVRGVSTLEVKNCRWDGGTMNSTSLPGGQPGQGVTVVPLGGTMTISGVTNVTLDNRQLLIHGAVVWGAFGNPFGDILVQNASSIINDGGRFDVWNDATIRNADERQGLFLVQNNGVFQKHITEYLGTTTIGIAFQNGGGTVQADGSVTFGGGFSQFQGGSLTVFGFGTYIVSRWFEVNAGTMQLQGGALYFPTAYVNGSPVPNFSNATFQGYGSLGEANAGLGISSGILYTDCAQITLTGNLTMNCVYLTDHTQTHLAGFTLNAYPPSLNEGGSAIYLENGNLTYMQNLAGSTIQGPGLYRGRQLNDGEILTGEGGR